MIDIISSSIRLGKLLKEHDELKNMSTFFSQILNESSDPLAGEYVQLLSSKFRQYGLYAFYIVDQILLQNIEAGEDPAKGIASTIRSSIIKHPLYNDILFLSQKYGVILDEYLGQLVQQIDVYPQIKLKTTSLKIQQCSNELSTAILRSGVLSWTNDPIKMESLKKDISFVEEYETQTAEFSHMPPYNKETRKIINSLNGNKRSIAYYIENIRFVQHLAKAGIIQGFFFELFDITDAQIIKIKEIHKNKSIHPIIIKTDIIYPNKHIFLFRYNHDEKVAYLLAKRMTIKITGDTGASTTLSGYCYPTKEYSLLKID